MSAAKELSPPDVLHMPVVVQRVLFANSDNGYCVAKVQDQKDSYNEFVAVGILGSIQEKDVFKISGSWVTNNYGKQLQVTDMVMPELNSDGVIAFLRDGQIKGIGPKTAELIYKKFGDELLPIFDQSPEKLLAIKGISEKKLEKIIDSWNALAGKRQSMIELRGLGLAFGVINKILRKYEKCPRLAVEKVKTDPYFLAWEVKGIGFLEADTVARRLGFSENCLERLHAAMGYALKLGVDQGHCYLTASEVLSSLKDEKIFRGFEEVTLDKIVREGISLEKDRRIVLSGDSMYLPSLYESEKGIASHLLRLVASSPKENKAFQKNVDDFKGENKIVFHPLQEEAIRVAGTKSVSIITGGPGTGKTTLIRGLIRALRGKQISLCAPTGRAAKRMSESSGIPAKTIHRLLGFNPQEGFAHNSENPLDTEVVIMDEASMLDVHLAYALFQAIPTGSQLILVGDVDQLPPVGAGQVFSDTIKSNEFPVIRLEQVYRQSEGSYIALNAQSIRIGDVNGINLSNKTEDFFWIPVNKQHNPAERQEYTRQMICASLDRLFNLGYIMDDIMLLSPMRQGPLGIEMLNTEIQARYNHHGKVVHKALKRVFKIGDRVIQCRNNYDKDVFNGDLGIITKEIEDGFVVKFDDREIEYEDDTIKELQLAYAMTIHKAQGCESKVTIQIISNSHYIMLNRALLYTGVTRAREKCILIGEHSAMVKAVKNDKIKIRNTSFRKMFSSLLDDSLGLSLCDQ